MHPATSSPSLRVRTGVTAGGYSGCLAYCDQERSRCISNPAMPRGVCDDRYPVCQNACAACASTPV